MNTPAAPRQSRPPPPTPAVRPISVVEKHLFATLWQVEGAAVGELVGDDDAVGDLVGAEDPEFVGDDVVAVVGLEEVEVVGLFVVGLAVVGLFVVGLAVGVGVDDEVGLAVVGDKVVPVEHPAM
jgi:hypothetical protein